MKTLKEYIENYITFKDLIKESIKPLDNNTTGIIVFDIDDTLLHVNPNILSIYKKEPGKQEIKLSTDEFANDPDANDINKRSWFDYRDFEDPVKVYNSIVTATPIIRNLRIMDEYIKAGYDFSFLTARSCEHVVKAAIMDFIRVKDSDGALKELGDEFKKSLSHAVNDSIRKYKGKTDSEKKANILKDLCEKYDKVVFVDDDIKNVYAARKLGLKNLSVIKAQRI